MEKKSRTAEDQAKKSKTFFFVALLLSAILWTVILRPQHIGYRLEHPVQSDETMSTILVNYLGSDNLAHIALKNMRGAIDSESIWANTENERNGDVVRIRDNTLTLVHPNGDEESTQFLPQKLYRNREVQMWIQYLVLVCILLIHALIAFHAKKDETPLASKKNIAAALSIGIQTGFLAWAGFIASFIGTVIVEVITADIFDSGLISFPFLVLSLIAVAVYVVRFVKKQLDAFAAGKHVLSDLLFSLAAAVGPALTGITLFWIFFYFF